MPLLTFIFIIVCVGVILWAVNRWVPMEPNYKKIMNVVAIIATIIWVLNVFGMFGPLSAIRVGR